MEQAVLILEATYDSEISCRGMMFVLVCAIVFFLCLRARVLIEGAVNEMRKHTSGKKMKELVFMNRKRNLFVNPNCCLRASVSCIFSIYFSNPCGYHSISSGNH